MQHRVIYIYNTIYIIQYIYNTIYIYNWVGWREHPQESMVNLPKVGGTSVQFPFNQEWLDQGGFNNGKVILSVETLRWFILKIFQVWSKRFIFSFQLPRQHTAVVFVDHFTPHFFLQEPVLGLFSCQIQIACAVWRVFPSKSPMPGRQFLFCRLASGDLT